MANREIGRILDYCNLQEKKTNQILMGYNDQNWSVIPIRIDFMFICKENSDRNQKLLTTRSWTNKGNSNMGNIGSFQAEGNNQ